MKTPMAYCANTFRRAPTCPVGMQTTSPRSPTPSTPDHAKPSGGAPLRRPSPNTYTRFTKPVLRPPIESALTAAIRMYYNVPDSRPLLLDRHPQRVGDQARAHMTIHRPTDDLPGMAVDNRGQIRPAAPHPNVRNIGEPQLVRPVWHELASDQVDQTVAVGLVLDCRGAVRARMNAGQASSTGETADTPGRVPPAHLGQFGRGNWCCRRRSTHRSADAVRAA